jgi:hypothetical protein
MSHDADFCGHCGASLIADDDSYHAEESARAAPDAERTPVRPRKESDIGDYLIRLVIATIMVGVVGALGVGVWFMWEFVINGYETWSYFPRGMFIIPAGITVSYGILAVMMAWLWLNALFNTEYSRQELDER